MTKNIFLKNFMDKSHSAVIMSGESNKKDISLQADGTEKEFGWSEGVCVDILSEGMS